MKAILKNYRQSPRKVRLVADAVRGKKVADAITTLRFMPKKAAEPVKKLIESAFANAKNSSVATESLIVKEISVNEGPTLKRTMPRARGSANLIRKRTSLISVVLGIKGGSVEVSPESVEVAKETKPKAVKKVAAKKITKSPKLKTKN
jgi:large subunit ribosomal protein L22